jgi:hypothetical protein
MFNIAYCLFFIWAVLRYYKRVFWGPVLVATIEQPLRRTLVLIILHSAPSPSVPLQKDGVEGEGALFSFDTNTSACHHLLSFQVFYLFSL